ncbi:MAG TPA: MBG domain-containing protein, partial [Vicinamibacterales bacterium]|nr:MBG domain-containing protein [Vicinamibacterales bacterium]
MTSLRRRRFAFGIVVAFIVTASGLLRAGTPQSVGTWRSLGATPDQRVGAAAVTLADGRVLITGGTIGGAQTATATVFNPVDGSFTSAGQLLLPRSGHTATVLKDGRVLIAGGVSQGVTTADLEIFDPSADSSTVPGSLTQARTGHAAALLADGRVFITGGTGVDGVLDTSDIFDPSDNSVTPTALHMLSPRTGASATTLIDGRVLIAGGNDGTQDLASAEIFDPMSTTFEQTTTALSVARSGHTAVLLPWNGSVLIAGGTSNGVAQAATDLFVPAQFPDPYSWGMGTFAATGALTQPRAGAVGAPHIEGYSVVIGGGATDAEVYRFATLKTDADDYAPGTKAVITGAGWNPNSDVTLIFQEDPAVHDDYVLHVTADAEGKIYWDQWAPEPHDLNVRFYLLAKQVLADGSERRAQITFTDGNATSVSGTVHNGSASGPGLSGVTITCTSGCNNSPAASTTSNTSGAYVFDNGTTKLSFGTNGPVTLQLTASKPGFTSQTITLSGVNNGATITNADFVLSPSISTTALSVQAASGTYGGTVNLSATLTSGVNPVSGKTVSFTLNGTSKGSALTNASGVASLSNVSLGSIAAGSYLSGVGASFAGDASFSSSSGTSSLTVNQATLTITPDGGKSKTYGQTFSAFTGTVSGLVNGDAGNATYASTGAPATANVGSYDITSSFAFTTGSASNYDVHTNTATNGLTVGKATLTVTPDGGKSKTYGDTFTAFTGAVTGLVNSDAGTPTYASSGAMNTANVGSYDVTSSFAFTTGSASNYDVHTNTATNGLTVGKATLTVTPDGGKSKTYGETFSAFTGTVTGLVNSDAGNATYASTGAPATANVGSYDITSSFAFTMGLASNYDVHTNTASNGLTVNQATLTITPDGGKSKTYG